MGSNIQIRSSMININRYVCSVEGPRHWGRSPSLASGPSGDGAPGSAAGWTINNRFTIHTPDANSFRQSQGQLMSEWVLALRRAEKRHG
jgi:hypothetical protein